ncbi:MAG: (deoxy)nucleoside triphosphate pyrophosphohydrolase [Gammaproteobacteria bacterium]|nr:(deoxy)nucleoside triphosphate pyrophosphohydrolase [Gammaproteobacteria bacterium]
MPSTVADNPVINPLEINEDYIHVVAALIWHRQNRQQFLIAQRQKGRHLEDYWEFPGGKLEVNESPWQGLRRELHEEINIRPTSAVPYLQVYYRYPDRNILLDTWLVEDYLGEIKPCEQQALAWIELTQIDSYRFPPADVPILEAIKCNATT